MSIIVCNNVYLAYNDKIVVSNLNLDIEEGDYVCIVGENGSGKTTFIKSILGLIKPISGTIIFNNNLNRSEIGYLPQNKSVQNDFPASVEEIVLSGCQTKSNFFSFYNKNNKLLVEHFLNLLNISQYKNKNINDLSGGLQQRAFLARALCSAKKTLILDEPTSNLDKQSSSDFYNIINDLNKSNHISILMVTHDISSSFKYANKVLHINQSSNYFGTMKEYIKTDFYKNISQVTDYDFKN